MPPSTPQAPTPVPYHKRENMKGVREEQRLEKASLALPTIEWGLRIATWNYFGCLTFTGGRRKLIFKALILSIQFQRRFSAVAL